MVRFNAPRPTETVEQYVRRVTAEAVTQYPTLTQAMTNVRHATGNFPSELRYWRALPLEDTRTARTTFSSVRTVAYYRAQLERDRHAALTSSSPRPLSPPIPPLRRGGAPQPLSLGNVEDAFLRYGAAVVRGMSEPPVVVRVKGRAEAGGRAHVYYSHVYVDAGIVTTPMLRSSLVPTDTSYRINISLAGGMATTWATAKSYGAAAKADFRASVLAAIRDSMAGQRLKSDRGVLVPARLGNFPRAVNATQERVGRAMGRASGLGGSRILWSLPSVTALGVDRTMAARAEAVAVAALRRSMTARDYRTQAEAEAIFGRNVGALPMIWSADRDEFVCDFGLTPGHARTCSVTGRPFLGHVNTRPDGSPCCVSLMQHLGVDFSTFTDESGNTVVLLAGETRPRRITLYGYHAGPRSYRASYVEPRIGVELEVCCNRIQYDSRARFLSEWQDEDDFILERDGSLDGAFGVEIVGTPLRFGDYVEGSTWHRMLSWLRENKATSWYNATDYGMHVNLSRAHLSRNQQAAILLAANRWKSLMRSIAGRESSFARFNAELGHPRLSLAIEYAENSLHGTDKYSCVNVKRHVLEFRLFRGTLSWEGFMRNVECVIALYHYVKDRVDEEIELSNFDAPDEFLQFVNNSREEYPNLRAFLHAKHWLGAEETLVHNDLNYNEAIAAFAA